MDTGDREARKKAIELAMKRRSGASSGHSERLSSFMESAGDLFSHCPACGLTRRGSLQQLKEPCENCGYGHGTFGH